MALYDYDGTASHEIGKIYDYDGTASHQTAKCYDNNGTTDTLIYNASEIAYQTGETPSGWAGSKTSGSNISFTISSAYLSTYTTNGDQPEGQYALLTKNFDFTGKSKVQITVVSLQNDVNGANIFAIKNAAGTTIASLNLGTYYPQATVLELSFASLTDGYFYIKSDKSHGWTAGVNSMTIYKIEVF